MDPKELEAKAKELDSKIESINEKQKELDQKIANQIAAGNDHLHVGGKSNSVEAKALSAFGVSSIPELLQVNVASAMYADVPREVKQAVIGLKRHVDVSRWCAQIFDGAPTDRGDMESNSQIAVVKGILDSKHAKLIDLKARFKAFGSTVVGAGDEWVPTAMSSQYIEEFELEKKIAARFSEIPMGSNPYEMPVKTGRGRARRIAEGATATSSQFGTSKLTFNAQKLVEYYEIPEELSEDSAPAILTLARQEVIEAQIRAMEDAILNGDTTATHMDSDTTDAADCRKSWLGLRKMALANSTYGSLAFSSGITTAKLDLLKKLMGKFGVDVQDLMLIVGPSGYNQMVSLDEVSTVEKFGNMATILNGALAAWRGIPVVVSEYVREDLNASGVHDGTTTDNTCVYLVNTRRFMRGIRRPIRTRIQLDPRAELDRTQLVSYQRAAFTGHVQSATEASVVLGIDVTK